MTFVRVFRQFPGNEVVGNIESVDVIDAPPPSLPLGLPTGTMVVVGEFERGALNQPLDITGANDQLQKFGGLGFPTTFSSNDGAVARRSGGNENWNGNGFIWLRNKTWRRLIAVRVDNSAGQVEFSRLACLTGGAGPFAAADADSITFQLNGGPTTATATVNGAAGTFTGTSGTFTGLDTLTIEIKVDKETSIVTTFTTAQTDLADVIALINATHAQTIASNDSGELALTSVIEGGSGFVQIVGGTAAVTLGFPAIVQQIDTTTVVAAQIGTYTLRTNLLVQGVSTNFDATYESADTVITNLRDGLLLALQNSGTPGVTFTSSGAADILSTGDDNITFTSSVEVEVTASDITPGVTSPSAVVRAGFGTGNVLNLAQFTVLEMAAIIDAQANLTGEQLSTGNLRTCNAFTPGTGTLQATTGNLIPILGYNVTDIQDANDAADVTIPAGTRVQGTSPDTVWVTLNDIETGSGGGTFDALVRPFEDTNTALANAASSITTIIDELPDGFSVTNAAAVTRLSAAQLDNRYVDALNSTLDLNTPASDADFIASARSSVAIIAALGANAEAATAEGLAPRKTFVRPLLGTSITDAQAATGQGVGLNRTDRKQYCFPGVVTQIPEISNVGARGGIGFSDNGLVEVGSDSFLGSIRSILNPEENAGQSLFDTNVGPLSILALESAFNPEQGGDGLVLSNYIGFKANGITAPIIDQVDGPQFQSDVTTILPTTNSALADASRRVMADFVIKTLSSISKPYVKKLNTPKRRLALLQQYDSFLNGLLSPNNPDTQRIAAFSVRDDSTDEQRRTGIQAFNVLVQTLPSILTVLLRVEVGTTVQVEEAA